MKLSLDDVSQKSGVSKKILSNFEDGLTDIQIVTIFKIACAIEMPASYSPDLLFLNWEEFIRKCVERRKEMHLPLKSITKSTSLSYEFIKKFEEAKRNIHLNRVLQILRILEISQSRRFESIPVRENFLSRRQEKYGSDDPIPASHILIEWDKMVEFSINARHALKFSQKQLAETAGVSLPTIVNFENYRVGLNINSALKIFNALHLEKNLSEKDLSTYFSILDWEAFVETAIERRQELCLSRNELSKFSKVMFPIVTKFEEGNTNLTLKSLIKILTVLELVSTS